MSKREPKHSKETNIKKMQELNYTKILTPKNMKSLVWKYFGFPGDNYNQIITKEIIFCTICFSKFNNCRNTTNLRTHLRRNHKSIHGFEKYVPDDKSVNQHKTNRTFKDRNSNIKYSARKSIRENTSDNFEHFSITDEYVDQCDTLYVNVDEMEQTIIDDAIINLESKKYCKNSPNSSNALISATDNHTDKNIPEVKVRVSYNMEDANNFIGSDVVHDTLRDMIIEDIQSTEMIGLKGFENTLKILSKGYANPQKELVEESIFKAYAEKSYKIYDVLKTHSQQKPFGLSFEIWENILNQQFITFYFYYISEDFEISFKDIQLKTIKFSQHTNLNEIFEGYNLKNCSAVVGVMNGFVEDYFSRYEIPIVPCFECTIKNCVNNIFDLDSVNLIYSEVKGYFEELLLTQDIGIPNLYRDFPWTKYNVLNFFCENICWPEDPNNELLPKAKRVLDCISSLKMTVDSLAEESNTISSLSRPLSNHLIENNFVASKGDSHTVCEIKETVNIELTKNILSNDLFAATSFLDPRFFRFLTEDSIATTEDILFSRIRKDNNFEKIIQTETLNETLNETKNSRKSGLKYFFSKSKDLLIHEKCTKKNSFENDLEKYKIEASVDLDECPLKWWNKYGYMYGHLKQLSDTYNCIPACCNNRFLFSIEARTIFEDRRANLTGNCINEILFLNYNK